MWNFDLDARHPAKAGFLPLDDAVRPLGLTARQAETPRQRQEVFALRHESYLAGGFIDRRRDGLFSDRFDERPNCRSIIVYREARPVASVRVCVFDPDPDRPGWDPGWEDIPALHVFPGEIRAVMAARAAKAGRVIEINRLVRHPDFVADPGLVFALFHLAGLMILLHGADIVFSCVRKNHIAFYRRLKFTPIAGPRAYPELKFPTNLLACSRQDFAAVRRMMPLPENPAPRADARGSTAGRTAAVFGRS